MPGYGMMWNIQQSQSGQKIWRTMRRPGLQGGGDTSSYERWINYLPVANDDFKAPHLENQIPADGAQVSKDTIVTFDVVDEVSVPLTGVTVWLEGNLAFNGASFVAPYDGLLSSVGGSNQRWIFIIQKTANWQGIDDVTVRVRAVDSWSNVLDTIYSFEADIGAPRVENRVPAADASITATGLLSFDVVDDNAGVNPSTLDAYIDGVWAFKGALEAFQSPYDGGSSSFTTTSVAGDDGYALVFDRTTAYSQDFTVEVYADDYRGNALSDSWRIHGPDVPFLRDESPARDSACNTGDTLISVNVVDGTAVFQNTIDAYVEGAWAYRGDIDAFIAPYNGGSSSITPVSVDGYDGYTLVIDNTGTYTGTVTTRYLAQDAAANQLDDNSYQFGIDDVAPNLQNQFPESGESGAAVDTLIIVDAYDFCSGIDPLTMIVNVKTNDTVQRAYTGSSDTFTAPWDGGASAVTTITDGYHIVVDRDGNFTIGDTVEVQVSASDYNGNHLDGYWSFAFAQIRFQIDAESGLHKLLDDNEFKYNVDGTLTSADLVYQGIDATASDWDARDAIGPTLSITGSNPAPTINDGSPLNGYLDGSVRFAGGKYYYDSTGVTEGNVTTDDFVIEMLIKTPDDDDIGEVASKGSAVHDGWIVENLLNKVILNVYGDSADATIQTDELQPNCWYKITFIYDSSGDCLAIVNGVLQNTVDVSGVGNITNSANEFRFGLFSNHNISFFGMWINASGWITNSAATLVAYEAERFRKMTSIHPTTADGSDVPGDSTRNSIAYLDKVESDGSRKLYLVGKNWSRCCKREDLSSVEREGILIEETATNRITQPIVLHGSPWVRNNCWLGRNPVVGPNGMSEARLMDEEASAGADWHGTSILIANGAGAAVTSAYVKAGNRDWFCIATRCQSGFCSTNKAFFNVSTGALGSTSGAVLDHTIEDMGNGWYRCSMFFDNWNSENIYVFVEIAESDGVDEFTGTTQNDSLRIFGVQHESVAVRKIPSSFYPIGGTRVSDVLRFPASGNIFDGYGRIDAHVLTAPNTDALEDTEIVICLSDGTDADNRIDIEIRRGSPDIVGGRLVADAAVATADGPSVEINDGDFHTMNIDYGYGDTNLQVTVDGSSGSATSGVSIPDDIDRINIGRRESSSGPFCNSLIAHIRIWEIL